MTEAAIQAAVHTLEALAKFPGRSDPEVAHVKADNVLINLICDDRVTDAFDKVPKWYA